jgi:hypothetical protein
MKKASVAILGLLALLVSAGILAAQTVTPGYLPHEEDLAAVRYRSFGNTGGEEIYLGIPDLGVAANRTARDFGTTQKWGSTNEVTFTYDPASDKLLTTVNTGSATFSLEYPNLSVQLPLKGKTFTPGDMNILQLSVVCRDTNNSTVSFNDVYLDGHFLGNFTAVGWLDWMVTDYDFSQGFTLTGRITLSGPFSNSQELSKVEAKVGVIVLCWDEDQDGYGDPASDDCAYPQLDCDDANPLINPGSAEDCENGLDDDCDGATDAEDTDCAPPPPAWSVGGTTAQASSLHTGIHGKAKAYNPLLALLLVPMGVILGLRILKSRR